MPRRIFALSLVCFLLPARLAAQENQAWPERIIVTINAPYQPRDNQFSESLQFADSIRRTEDVKFKADYASRKGPLFDAGIGVRMARNIGLGVSASLFQRSDPGAFELAVPSPIVANRPLNLKGSVSGLNREELGVHIQTLYAVAIGRQLRVLLGGGPSILRVEQDLVRSVEFDMLPGFASLRFNQATVAQARKTVIGFNVGADLNWRLASHIGVGGMTRYSRANFVLDPGSASGMTRAIDSTAGGFHVGGGLRLMF
jgi:hypothetical protein